MNTFVIVGWLILTVTPAALSTLIALGVLIEWYMFGITKYLITNDVFLLVMGLAGSVLFWWLAVEFSPIAVRMA